MGNKCPCLAPKTGGSKEYAVNEGKSKKKDKTKDEKKKKKQASKYAMPSEGAENEGFEVPTNQDPDEFTNIANIAPNGDGPKSSTRYRTNSTEEVEIVLENDPDHERAVDVPGEPKVNFKVTKSPDSNHNDTGDIEIHEAQGRGVVSLDDGEEFIDTRLRLPSADLDLDQLTDSQKQQYVNPAFDKDSLSSAEDISIQENEMNLEKPKTIEPDNVSKSSSSVPSESGKDSVKLPESDILPDEIDLKFENNTEPDDMQHLKYKTFETKFELPQDDNENIEKEEQIGAVRYMEESESEDGEDQIPDTDHVKHKTYETQINLESAQEQQLQTNGQSMLEALAQVQKKYESDYESDSDKEREVQVKENEFLPTPKPVDFDSENERGASPDINNVVQVQKDEDQRSAIDSDVEEDKASLKVKTQEARVILDGAIDSLPNESSDFDLADKTDDRQSVSSVSSDEYKEMAGRTASIDSYPHLIERGQTPVDDHKNIVEERKQEAVQSTNHEMDMGNEYMDMQGVQNYKQNQAATYEVLDIVQTTTVSIGKDAEEQPQPPADEHNDAISSESEEEQPVQDDTEEEEKTTVDNAKKPKYPWDDESPDDENRELEEILLLIEKLEDSLVEDLDTSQDAETLSRNIVEKLDEISALREQAEMDVPIETIMEEMQDEEDDEEEFDTEEQVIDWYNRRLDELNEAVGMDLLEMSMTKSLSDETLEPLFNQHAESQTYFIRRRLVELEKLRRKQLVTNQKPLFEPKPEPEIELQRPTRPKMYHSDEESDDDDQQPQAGKDHRNLFDHRQEEADEALRDKDDSAGSFQESKKPEVMVGAHPGLMPENVAQDQQFIINQEHNVFEESDVDMGPGVNQFVSPSKSEEDLWFKVESLQSKEVVYDNTELEAERSRELQMHEPEQNDMGEQNEGETPAEFEQFSSSQYVHKHDATKMPAKSILKASMMYGTDSESEDEEDFNDPPNVKTDNLSNMAPFNIDKTSNEFEEDHIYSTPSSIPVKFSQNDDVQLQQEEAKSKPEFTYNVEEYGNNVNEVTGKAVVKARMISRSSSESSSVSSSESEHVDKSSPFDIKEEKQEYQQDEDSEDDHVYSVPTSRPVKLPSTEASDDPANTVVPEVTENKVSVTPVEDDAKCKPKLTMYGSSSDESETEELIQKAYAMDGGVSSSDSDVHQLSVIKPQVVQENQSSDISDLNMDSPLQAEHYGAVGYSEEDVVGPNDIFGEFQSETFDRLQSSQDHASDLLSELKALSGKQHQDDEYLGTFDQKVEVDSNIVQEEKYTFSKTESNKSLPTNKSLENEPFGIQLDQDHSGDKLEYDPTLFSMPQSSSSVLKPVSENDSKHQVVENVVEEAVYNPPTDFASGSGGLMSLTMEPIPPILDDVDTENKANIQICSKETGESYPVHSTDGANQSSYNGHQKLSRKQSREIILSESSDTDTDELIKAAVGKHGKASGLEDDAVQSSASDGEDDDTDTEGVIQKYGEALKMKKAKPITSVDSDSDVSKGDSSEYENETDEEYEAEVELKETLKEDIVGSISTLTKDDFRELMGIYREEREGIKDMRSQEKSRVNMSLLEKLQRRREAVDQYVHEGDQKKSQQSTGVGVQVSPSVHSAGVGDSGIKVTETAVGGYGAEQSDSENSDVNEEDQDVEESIRDVEELTQTIQLMDLEIVQHAAENADTDDVNVIIKEHFDMVDQLRKNKDTNLRTHRNKVKAKLQARSRKLSASSSDDSCNDENTCEKDAFIDGEMDSLKESYLEAITSRDQVSEQELHDIIVQYREDQQDLIRKREFEKLRINEKLRERVRAQKDQQKLSQPKAEPETARDTRDDRDSEFLTQMSKMDEEFYKELFRLQAMGQLDDEEMGHMIEEHLDRAEEFRRKVKGEVEKRRKKRDKMTDSRKLKQADLIIQTEKEEARKIRQIREQEKQVSDTKLQQKLLRKKKYEDTPELPPGRRSSKNKKSRASHMQIANYENVEYEC